MIDVRKLEMETLTRTELDRLEHRIGYARAKLDQGAHDLVEDVVPKARLKKLLSDYRKARKTKKFKVTLPVMIEVAAGWSDDFDGDIGLDWDWDGDEGIDEQVYNQLTDKKFLAACPPAKDYIKKLQELEKSVKKEMIAICKEYHLNDDDIYDYVYEQEEE